MSFRNMKNPSGGVNPERVIKSAEPDENLMEQIFCTENVRSAWKQVKSNKGKPGIDGITINAFPELMHSTWMEMLQSLFDGTYQPDPVRRVEIPKATGGLRPLGIPTVLDRVIQQSVARVLGSMRIKAGWFRPIVAASLDSYSRVRKYDGRTRHFRRSNVASEN